MEGIISFQIEIQPSQKGSKSDRVEELGESVGGGSSIHDDAKILPLVQRLAPAGHLLHPLHAPHDCLQVDRFQICSGSSW